MSGPAMTMRCGSEPWSVRISKQSKLHCLLYYRISMKGSNAREFARDGFVPLSAPSDTCTSLTVNDASGFVSADLGCHNRTRSFLSAKDAKSPTIEWGLSRHYTYGRGCAQYP